MDVVYILFSYSNIIRRVPSLQCHFLLLMMGLREILNLEKYSNPNVYSHTHHYGLSIVY